MENNLPNGWVETSISEYAEIAKAKGQEGIIPYLEIGDIDIISKTYQLKEKPSVKGCKLSKRNDILISRVRPTRGAITIIDEDNLCVSSAFSILRFEKEIEAKSAYYQIAFNANFLNYLGENCTGTMYPTVSEEVIENFKINLPPLPEQHRIVAKLDTVMQKVESNKQRLEKIPTILKRFRQSVLNAALNGKLTEEWREQNKNVKNIFDVIESIAKQRKLDYENLIKEFFLLGKSKPRRPENLIPTVNNIDDYPESWGAMTFSDISSTKQYSMSSGPFGSSLGTKDYRATGVPVVRGQNIQGGVFLAKNFVFISDEKAIELTRSSAVPNDIVIVAVGVGVGSSAIIPNEIEKIILSQNCNKFSLDSKIVVPKFILFNLQVSNIKEQMDEATTDTAREFLSLTNLKKLLFPIPPIEEQKEIIRRVEQLFAFADKIEARYTKAKTKIDKLPQSILAKAFRGELVPQNPDDEPATVLLERIKAEKAKLNGAKKEKKKKSVQLAN